MRTDKTSTCTLRCLAQRNAAERRMGDARRRQPTGINRNGGSARTCLLLSALTSSMGNNTRLRVSGLYVTRLGSCRTPLKGALFVV